MYGRGREKLQGNEQKCPGKKKLCVTFFLCSSKRSMVFMEEEAMNEGE
jgi:hypothetical protein